MTLSLEDAFREYCSFGDKDSLPLMMDGAKFAKMCRDCKLLDKKLTATDVDIIFAKAKPKTERKLTLAQFQEAVRMLGEKKYPGDPQALKKIQSKLSTPTTHPGATKVAGDAVLDRMTDTSKYTGSHKLRFDESGKGKGLEGRESVSKGPGHIPPLVSAQPSYVTGNRIGLDAVDSGRAQDSPKARAKAASEARSSPKPAAAATAAKSSPKPSQQKSSPAKASPRVQSKAGASPSVKNKAAGASPSLKTKTAGVSPSVKKSTVVATTSSPTKSKVGCLNLQHDAICLCRSGRHIRQTHRHLHIHRLSQAQV
jgi:hypothetical protein